MSHATFTSSLFTLQKKTVCSSLPASHNTPTEKRDQSLEEWNIGLPKNRSLFHYTSSATFWDVLATGPKGLLTFFDESSSF